MEYQKILDSISDNEIKNKNIKKIILDINPDYFSDKENEAILLKLKKERPKLYKSMTLDTATKYM